MKWIIVLGGLCALCSCDKMRDGDVVTLTPDVVGPQPDLKGASSLKIGFWLNGQQKFLSVEKAPDVQSILATIEVRATYRNAAAGIGPIATVDFSFPNRTVIETRFVSPEELRRDDWGTVHLHRKFYDKINEVASAAEGRPIDVLTRNQ